MLKCYKKYWNSANHLEILNAELARIQHDEPNFIEIFSLKCKSVVEWN